MGNLARNWLYFEEAPRDDGSKSPSRAINSIAINKGKNGQGEDLGADFINVTCFGRTADIVADQTEKGQFVTVNGRLTTYRKDYPEMINPQSGQPHSDYQVSIVGDYVMPGPKSKKSQAAPAAAAEATPVKPEVAALLAAMTPEMKVAFAKALAPSLGELATDAEAVQNTAKVSADEAALLQELAGKQGRDRTSSEGPF